MSKPTSRKSSLKSEPSYDFTLVAVATQGNVYQLAHFINRLLRVELCAEGLHCITLELPRRSQGVRQLFADGGPTVGVPTTSEHAHLACTDMEHGTKVQLLSNRGTVAMLIPERPDTDFFLKLTHPRGPWEQVPLREALLKVPKVLAVAFINPLRLPSRAHLLLDHSPELEDEALDKRATASMARRRAKLQALMQPDVNPDAQNAPHAADAAPLAQRIVYTL